MATINLSWTPAGGPTSTGQTVQRKLASASTWSDLATGLAPTANSYADTTAADNTLYDYRVLNICSAGGPSAGGTAQADNQVCPTVTATVPATGEEDVINWTVGNTSGDNTITTVVIIDNTSAVVNTTNVNSQTGTSGTYDTGQAYGETFTIRATITDGVFTKTCDATVTIGSQPTCGAPTGLTATPA